MSTDEGLVPIKNLDETTAEFEQWDEIEVGVSTDGGTKTATAVYDNGFADVRRIETEGGFSVASTPDHRFRTITDDGEYVWREAAEFEPGDRILLQRGTFDSGSRATLDTSERQNYHWNSDEQLELPSEMTPELAEFLGYFMGDGYVHEDVGVKLVVESDAEELDAYLRELGESVFGVSPTVEDRDTRHVLVFGGRHLPRYFEDNGWKKADGNEGEGAASAFVPDEVLQGDEAVAKAFLRGLFEADGTASRKVELSTVSKTLADQVQTLLLALGCVFVRDTLETAGRNDHYGDRPRHSVRGANKREDQRFLKEVGFITKSTEFDLTPQSYKNDTYPPAVVDSLRDVSGYDSVSKPVKKRVNQSPINGSVSRKLVRDVEEETGETVWIDGRPLVDFYAATVDSVTEEKAYTKDISVPSNNTYVANGFVTHNTTSMVGNTTGGCEPIYNVAYYKNVSDDVQGDEMLVEFDDYFLRVLEENDIDVEAVKKEAQEQMAENEFDGIDGLSTVPDAIGELFVTTGDLDPKQHASIQCALQDGVDSAISKTVNAPNDSTVEDAKESFEYIYEHGGKGVTYYRDGTRSKQVLTTRAQNTEFADMDREEIVAQIEEVFDGIEGFLESEEVQAALEESIEDLLGVADGETTEYAQKRPRPDVLHGVTQRIDTGYGKLYVNINEDEDGRPFELFANIGNSGGFTASFTEALAKTISTALRSGVDPEEIADELQGIRSPKVAWDKGEQIQSIPDAIGTAMRRYLDNDIERAYPQQQNLTELEDEVEGPQADAGSRSTDGGAAAADEATTDDQQKLIENGESPECPECGSMSLYYSEGCKTCENCGWSEC
ncbi:TSCPD domain-containing protein [Halapricum desulfuricans]|uniref:TSCPD domain-containing protein n=1 Tax=Halapricum desulfuricans TaxID=2841257 RepID=UPI0037424E0B